MLLFSPFLHKYLCSEKRCSAGFYFSFSFSFPILFFFSFISNNPLEKVQILIQNVSKLGTDTELKQSFGMNNTKKSLKNIFVKLKKALKILKMFYDFKVKNLRFFFTITNKKLLQTLFIYSSVNY